MSDLSINPCFDQDGVDSTGENFNWKITEGLSESEKLLSL